MAIIDLLDTGGLPELGLVQTALQPSVFSGREFPIDQQAQAFFEASLRALGHLGLLQERLLHAHQFQGWEFVERGMRQHRGLLVKESNTRVLGYSHDGGEREPVG